jgi:hypothetical protein
MGIQMGFEWLDECARSQSSEQSLVGGADRGGESDEESGIVLGEGP